MQIKPRTARRIARVFFTALVCLALCPRSLLGQTNNATAERLLYNGKLFTAEPAHPYAEAVAIRGDKIVAVGSRSQAASALGANAETMDLQGKSLLPGFVDSHNHAV